MRIKKEIREGATIPKYYGIAYLELDRLIAIAYPIPLNILVGIWRKTWNWFKAPENVFKSGYDKGYVKGSSEGRSYAFNQYKEQVKTQELKNIIDNFLTEWEKQFKLPKEQQEGWIWKFIDKEKKRITI